MPLGFTLQGRDRNMNKVVVVVLGVALAAMGCGDDNGGTAGTGGTGATGGTGGAGGTGGTGGMAACGDPTGGPLFDLSAAVFKPYNSLLPDLTGCDAPDLTGNPGANLTGIDTKCLILTDPDISGCMQFEETSAGVFDVTGEQTLSFVIDITVPAPAAQVIITTNSVTAFSGTGTGSLPGTITMDDLMMGTGNVVAAATGNVNCQALDPGTGADISAGVCPLANLDAGDNAVPLPGDPGSRTFPPITVGADTFELGAGPADPTGYYLVNPPMLAGNGTQWAALAGDLTNAGTGGSGGAGGAGGSGGGN